MTFDNDLPDKPSNWQMVKDHVPIVLLVGGLATVFIGLHTAATTVAGLAALHVVGAGVIFGVRYLRQVRGGESR